MALYIPHSIFHLGRLLYVRTETFGPYYVPPTETILGIELLKNSLNIITNLVLLLMRASTRSSSRDIFNLGFINENLYANN